MVELQTSGDFGACLRKFRIGRGLSQQKLAERANISVAAICALESGRRHAPHRETLNLITSALNLDSDGSATLASAAHTSKRLRSDRRIQRLPKPPPSTLPWHLSSFEGRESEILHLTNALAKSRLITVSGPIGVGKSRLATSVARLQENIRSVLYVDIARLYADLVENVRGVSVSLELRGQMETLIERATGLASASKILLVLDNCELALEEVATSIVDLLQTIPNLQILGTSREPLRISGEFVMRIPPLSESAASRLFRDRCSGSLATDVSYDAQEISDICALVDRLPLAIELAAAWSRSMSFATLRCRLSNAVALLSSGRDTRRSSVPESLSSSLRRSFNTLSSVEIRLARELSHAKGTFSLDDVAKRTTNPSEHIEHLDALATLVDKALLEHDPTRSKYWMLNLTRNYIWESTDLPY